MIDYRKAEKILKQMEWDSLVGATNKKMLPLARVKNSLNA